MLTSNPNDQQQGPSDELTRKLHPEGSNVAKAALASVDGPQAIATVTKLNGEAIGASSEQATT